MIPLPDLPHALRRRAIWMPAEHPELDGPAGRLIGVTADWDAAGDGRWRHESGVEVEGDDLRFMVTPESA